MSARWITALHLSLLLPLLLSLSACSQAIEEPERLGVTHWFPLELGDQSIEVQVALSLAEMNRGLKHRTELEPQRGMLFIYPDPRQLSFFMEDTLIDLDIGFFDADGVLREVYPMFARDTSSVRSRGTRMRYALEMNQGWYREHQILPGTQLDSEALRSILEARGADPSRYGL